MTAPPRRIVVALDASPASLAACRAAAALAAARGAALIGVFVEDIDLVRSAQTGRRELGAFSASPRRLDLDELEAQLRVRAGQARRALDAAARAERVEATFRVVRGSVAVELRTAAAGAEIVTLGRVGWSLAGRGHVGSTVRALLSAGHGRLLILPPDRCISEPVRVVLEPSVPVDDLIDAAAELAGDRQKALELISFAPDEPTASALSERARIRLADRGLTARARWLGAADGDALARATEPEAGVLVVAAASRVFRPESLTAIDTPVLLVR